MAYDPKIIAAIEKRAAQVKDPRKRDRYRRAAGQIAIVESGVQNLDHGDADSKNWRQERESVYGSQWAKTGGPLNSDAIADRLFNEFEQFDHGQPSWQLAADVQRPAAQYRGRYKDVASQAASLFKGGASAPSSAGTPASAAPGSSGSGQAAAPVLGDPGQAPDVTSLLASLLSRPPTAPQAQPVAAPSFTAHPNLPGGVQMAVPQTSAPDEQSGGVQDALSLLGSLQGADPAQAAASGADAAGSTAEPVVTTVRNQRAAAKSMGLSGSKILELIYNNGGAGYGIKNGQDVNGSQTFAGVWAGHANHVHVAAGPKTVVALGKYAQSLGLNVGENSHFGGVNPGAHVEGSYHNKDEAIDVSGDAKRMERFAKAVDAYNRTRRLPAIT